MRCGAQEEAELRAIAHEQRLLVDSNIARLSRLVQGSRSMGRLEAHRLINTSKMMVAFERLAQIKEYRTPQLFRAFARVYILCIGALYTVLCASGSHVLWLRARRRRAAPLHKVIAVQFAFVFSR